MRLPPPLAGPEDSSCSFDCYLEAHGWSEAQQGLLMILMLLLLMMMMLLVGPARPRRSF